MFHNQQTNCKIKGQNWIQQADRALFPQMAKIPENFLNEKMLEEVKNKTFISVHGQVNNNEKVDKKNFFLWQVLKKI